MERSQKGLPVDTHNLVKYLEHSFSDSLTFLGEMLQNARRAKATKVRFDIHPLAEGLSTVTVSDNGVGINEDSLLFTVAKSGWGNRGATQDVMESDDPFGMGFLSVLFACGSILIESPGFYLSGFTRDILNHNKFHCALGGDCGSDVTQGTRITLLDVNKQAGELVERLTYLSLGFPIEVFIDGLQVPRPYAQKDTDFSESFGTMRVEDPTWSNNPYMVYFLQGLPIQVGPYDWNCRENPVVVHLDSRQFKARVPDRARLYDDRKCEREVKNAYDNRHFARHEFLAMKYPMEFAGLYNKLKHLGPRYRGLFNEIPYLPKQLTFVPREAVIPYVDNFVNETWIEQYPEVVSKTDIESGEVTLLALQDNVDMLSSGAVLETWWMYLSAQEGGVCNYVGYADELDARHWVNGLPVANKVSSQQLRAHVAYSSGFSAYFKCSEFSVEVVFCDSYTIKVEYDEDCLTQGDMGKAPALPVAEITDVPLWTGEQIIIPEGCKRAHLYTVLLQYSQFTGDLGYFDSRVYDEITDEFLKFVGDNRTTDPLAAFKSLISPLRLQDYPLLAGKKFTVALDEKGNVSVDLGGV